MLKSEAFCGQLVKITHGDYKGKVGIIYHTYSPKAHVMLANEEATEKWEVIYLVAYKDMEQFYAPLAPSNADTIPQVKPFNVHVTIDANGTCHIKDGSVPNTKYYDEHYASMVGLEPIELMQLVLSPAEFIGFLKGNIIKYSMRAGKKQGEAAEKDVTKAKRYTEWLRKANYFDHQVIINPKED